VYDLFYEALCQTRPIARALDVVAPAPALRRTVMSETRSMSTRIAKPADGTTAGGGQSHLGLALLLLASPQLRRLRAMTHTQSAERVLSTQWAVMLDASSQAWTRDVNGLLTQASAVALAQTMRASGQTAHVQATVTTIIDYAS
jgi:hypothetical protein